MCCLCHYLHSQHHQFCFDSQKVQLYREGRKKIETDLKKFINTIHNMKSTQPCHIHSLSWIKKGGLIIWKRSGKNFKSDFFQQFYYLNENCSRRRIRQSRLDRAFYLEIFQIWNTQFSKSSIENWVEVSSLSRRKTLCEYINKYTQNYGLFYVCEMKNAQPTICH